MTISYSTHSLAVKLRELQEVRYAKALIAYNNQEYTKAFNFIVQNMDLKNVHRPSLELLAKIHEKRQAYKKSIRVYNYLMKTIKAQRFLKLKFNEDMQDNLEKLKKPDEQSMQYIFKLANLYMNYFDYQKKYIEQKNLEDIKNQKLKEYNSSERIIKEEKVTIYLKSKEDRQQEYLALILARSEKYFKIAHYYKYSESLTLFMLGLIEKRKENNFKASDLFKRAYTKLSDNQGDSKISDESKSLREILEFYIGNSLLRDGHRELATRYFRNLGNNSPDDSLQNYSKFYIDGLNSDFLSYYAGLGLGYDTNPYNQDPSNITSANFAKADTYFIKQVGFFYNSDQNNDWAYNLNGGFEDFTYSQPEFRGADLRTLSFGSQFKFLYLPKAITKFGFNFYKYDAKNQNASEFSSFSTAINFYFTYDRYLESGIISYSLPVTMTNYTEENSGAQSTEMLLSISYTPWGQSKYFSPSYNVSAGKTSTNGVNSPSTNVRLSFTNQLTPKNGHNIFAGISYSGDFAQIEAQTTQAIDLNAQWLIDLNHWVSGLTYQVRLSSGQITSGESSPTKFRRHRISNIMQISF